jgi:nucleoside-diphosphate-sugar epimerase
MLVDEGHSVWGLKRNIEGLPEGVKGLQADLTDPSTLLGLPEGLEFVFYAASADARKDEAYVSAYVKGLQNLLNALDDRSSPVRRVFFTSSTAVYGHTDGAWVDESSTADPLHFTGARMLDAEQVLAGGPFPSTAVRLGGIYGPTRTRLLRQVYQGEAQLPADRLYTNRIHRDDCAGMLVHLMEQVHPSDLYLGVDHEPATLEDVLVWMAERLGVDPPLRARQGDGGGTRRIRRSSKRCRNDRICNTGYEFRFTSFRDGYLPVIDAFLRQH